MKFLRAEYTACGLSELNFIVMPCSTVSSDRMCSLSLPPLLMLLTLVLVSSSLALDIRYVKPDSPSHMRCDQPCLTLEQYASKTTLYFTAGATFVFLAGNHSLATRIELNSVSNLTFRGTGDKSLSEVNVIYSNGASITCRNVTRLEVVGLTFQLHSDTSAGFALYISEIFLSKTAFFGSSNRTGLATVAVRSEHSILSAERCKFEGITGGAITVWGRSNVNLTSSSFNSNTAMYGGAVNTQESQVSLTSCNLTANSAHNGGAIYAHQESNVTLHGNMFGTNRAALTDGTGGAVYALDSHLTLCSNVFSRNSAEYGGGLYLLNCSATVVRAVVGNTFVQNSASSNGGALHLDRSILNSRSVRATETTKISAVHTHTNTLGGLVLASYAENFLNNSAGAGGGGVSLVHSSQVLLQSVKLTGNSGSALFSDHSNLTITGRAVFSENTGNYMGGGIYSAMSSVSVSGCASFVSNTATFGGAVSAFESTIAIFGNISFQGNSAHEGGALYTSGTNLSFGGVVNFTSNLAIHGGGMYFTSAATLTLHARLVLSTADNYASEFGGVIYHDDTPTQFQCDYIANTALLKFLPFCFLQLRVTNTANISGNFHITSHNDSAWMDGDYFYGGLLDKCLLDVTGDGHYRINSYELLMQQIFPVSSKYQVISQPYYLLFCDRKIPAVQERHVYRGQTFNVSLVALGQGYTILSTLVTAKVQSTASLKFNQSTQNVSQHCTELSYNMFSTKSHEELKLYADGPCRDTGKAVAVVKVTFRPCPDAFVQTSDQCTCERRLRAYNANCIIEERPYIVREAGSSFWMSALYYPNGSYQGLVLCETCPTDYCVNNPVKITLDDPDVQCDFNRSGVLCGACAANHSLTLGTSRCQVCSDAYLALLVAFAAAGVALIVFLTFLRLTVATGMINGLVLYANIVQANRRLFLSPDHTSTFLTTFIAWLNLDLGIQTCFYDGMDAYVQTFLQFAFPAYVWLLMCLIVLSTRYSITISRLVGTNPIAVLATLLLMSYNKILRIIIEVYSSVDLDYPGNRTVSVWLKDANVPYLKSKHLLLTVVTSLVVAFLFLPYTFLLLLAHKFLRFSDRRAFRWLNTIKPLLDSYYAPYRFHTRCWTGLLLLVRCALYVVEFTLGGMNRVAEDVIIVAVFTGAAGYLASGKIYSNMAVNVVELSLYLNLVVLSAVSATGASSPTLVNALVGIAFVTTVWIIVHHFHVNYIARLSLWQRIKVRLRLRAAAAGAAAAEPDVVTPLLSATAIGQQRSVSQSFVDIREPLLEN